MAKTKYSTAEPLVVLLMGVAGSGKTTLGQSLAERLGWIFLDADSFHSLSSVEKMRVGMPLSDLDREPWLSAIHEELIRQIGARNSCVLACSALKSRYRESLCQGIERFMVVHLVVSKECASARLSQRQGHFFPASLIESQFEDLEPPIEALHIQAEEKLDSLLRQLIEIVSEVASR